MAGIMSSFDVMRYVGVILLVSVQILLNKPAYSQSSASGFRKVTEEQKQTVLKRTRSFLRWYYLNGEELFYKRKLIVEKHHESDGQLESYLQFLRRSGYFSEPFMRDEQFFFEDVCYQKLMHLVHDDPLKAQTSDPDPCKLNQFKLSGKPASMDLSEERYTYYVSEFSEGRMKVRIPGGLHLLWVKDKDVSDSNWKLCEWPVKPKDI